jgi:hypothetical protein
MAQNALGLGAKVLLSGEAVKRCVAVRAEECSMAGKFEIHQDKAGKFRFRLKAGNGEIIAVGEAYETRLLST